jgi:hypothetical protein
MLWIYNKWIRNLPIYELISTQTKHQNCLHLYVYEITNYKYPKFQKAQPRKPMQSTFGNVEDVVIQPNY